MSSSPIIRMACTEDYMNFINLVGITLNMEGCKRIILESLDALAHAIGGKVKVEASLLEEVVNLVEAPLPILGVLKNLF
jgi:glycyl-tRNA synthetase